MLGSAEGWGTVAAEGRVTNLQSRSMFFKLTRTCPHLPRSITEVTVRSDGSQILGTLSVSLGTSNSKFSASVDR